MKKRAKSTAVARFGKKGLTFVPMPYGGATWNFSLPGSKINYEREVGHDGLRSSVITSALCWVMRAFPEAPVVVDRLAEEQWLPVQAHDMTKLLRKPNPFYGGRVLLMATIMDFCFGEAFWLKVRNQLGELTELWWVPRALITPKWDENDPKSFITHYEYQTIGAPVDYPVEDVVHFRFGQDPENPRRGFSPLASIFREVYIDDQAANFTASILRNLGIIGVVFSPKAGIITKDVAEKTKEYLKKNFGGDKRGNGLVLTAPTDVSLLQYNLQGFDVGPLRDVSEERVCAALGIQPAVVGFGTGLQQTKVGATMKEVVKLSWEQGIEPPQAICADEMDRSLLPEFQDNISLFRTRFDTTVVDAINETKSEKTDRVTKLVAGNIIKVSQAQKELGYPVDKSQDKYLREMTAPAPTPPNEPAPPNRIAPKDEPAATGNGGAP